MANLKVDTVSGIGTEGTVFDGGLHFRSKNYLTLPKGTTAERTATSSGISTEIGSIRYNTDSNKMECYVNNKWMIVSTSSSDLNGGTRVLQAGGNAPSNTNNVIQFFTLSTAGNAQDFGDLLDNGRSSRGAASSSTRGLFANFEGLNNIMYVTIASTGNALDFGDTTYTGRYKCGLSNQTRAIFTGGRTNPATYRDDICFVTTASTGNAVDFGNLEAGNPYMASFASPTRGVVAGGYRAPGATTNIIQFVTISSTGNSQDFGDLMNPTFGAQGASNSTRGLVSGGQQPSPVGNVNTIQYTTIATTGNATNFGDSTNKVHIAGGAASPTRAAFFGGYTGLGSPNATNEINYVSIATEGDAVDFGDLTLSPFYSCGLSNGHGGL